MAGEMLSKRKSDCAPVRNSSLRRDGDAVVSQRCKPESPSFPSTPSPHTHCLHPCEPRSTSQTAAAAAAAEQNRGKKSEGGRETPDSQAQRDKPIPVIVVPLEDVRHPLQADARLHEQVEADGVVAAPVVRAEQQRDELRAQPVAERDQRLGELAVLDRPAAVPVEAVEQLAPCVQERPQAAACGGVGGSAGGVEVGVDGCWEVRREERGEGGGRRGCVPELVEAYGAGAVGVEHSVLVVLVLAARPLGRLGGCVLAALSLFHLTLSSS